MVTDVYNTGKGYAFVTFDRKEDAETVSGRVEVVHVGLFCHACRQCVVFSLLKLFIFALYALLPAPDTLLEIILRVIIPNLIARGFVL